MTQNSTVPAPEQPSDLPWLQPIPNYIPCNQCGACYAGEACGRLHGAFDGGVLKEVFDVEGKLLN